MSDSRLQLSSSDDFTDRVSLRKAADPKAGSWSLGGPPANSTNLSTVDFASPRQSGTNIMADGDVPLDMRLASQTAAQ